MIVLNDLFYVIQEIFVSLINLGAKKFSSPSGNRK